jgi:hypothetical protein
MVQRVKTNNGDISCRHFFSMWTDYLGQCVHNPSFFSHINITAWRSLVVTNPLRHFNFAVQHPLRVKISLRIRTIFVIAGAEFSNRPDPYPAKFIFCTNFLHHSRHMASETYLWAEQLTWMSKDLQLHQKGDSVLRIRTIFLPDPELTFENVRIRILT